MLIGPPGVIYASVQNISGSRAKLQDSVCDFLASFSPESPPTVLWSLSYITHHPSSYERSASVPEATNTSRVSTMPAFPYSIALEDEMLGTIRTIWENVLGLESREPTFLRFEEREQDPDRYE
jgi:hypothetical protein